MLNKLTSVTLVATLVIVLSGVSAFATNSSNPDVTPDAAKVSSEAPANNEAKSNERLKNSMLKLVADAKAGKVMPAPKSQIQPTQKNNWSKGKKIAIGVGIALAVVAVVLIATSPILHDGY